MQLRDGSWRERLGIGQLAEQLRIALEQSHPELRDTGLVNFKVRILDETKGTEAVTRVLLDASNGHDVWGSIGVSENVIEASWEALVDSLEYAIQPGRTRVGGIGSGGATGAAT